MNLSRKDTEWPSRLTNILLADSEILLILKTDLLWRTVRISEERQS